jgi:hypothetical protein
MSLSQQQQQQLPQSRARHQAAITQAEPQRVPQLGRLPQAPRAQPSLQFQQPQPLLAPQARPSTLIIHRHPARSHLLPEVRLHRWRASTLLAAPLHPQPQRVL